jgi:hypothetical protein
MNFEEHFIPLRRDTYNYSSLFDPAELTGTHNPTYFADRPLRPCCQARRGQGVGYKKILIGVGLVAGLIIVFGR